MTPETFKAWRKRLSLSQREAAARIGISLRQLQNYEAGSAVVPQTVALACAAIAMGAPPHP